MQHYAGVAIALPCTQTSLSLSVSVCVSVPVSVSVCLFWCQCRYDSMRLSDDNQGDDGFTRLVSGIFFIVGINVQVCVLCHFVLESRSQSSLPSSSSATSSRDHYISAGGNNCSGSGSGSGSSSGGGGNSDNRIEQAPDLPDKWTNIEINGGGSIAAGRRLPDLALGFLPKMGSSTQKFVKIQSMEVER